MSTENKVVSMRFDDRIDDQVKEILKSESITLPRGNDHPLVQVYKKKIESTYDVTRSKEDTDNAIQLLYIAYNTTPQEEDDIRKKINNLMGDLVKAQQQSELKMEVAARESRRIASSLSDFFDDWKEVCDEEDNKELRIFLSEDLLDLAKDIKDRAKGISDDLTNIAATYDGIITETREVSNAGETTLATRLKNRETIEREINKNKAARAKLESIVQDLQDSITNYEKKAQEYKLQADSNESSAFIMSCIGTGAKMVLSTVPGIAQGITTGIAGAATGGVSLMTSLAMSGASLLTSTLAEHDQETNKEAVTTDSDNTTKVTETPDNTAKVINIKSEISEKEMEIEATKEKKAELEEKHTKLMDDKTRIESKEDSDTKTKELIKYDKRIEDNASEIKRQDDTIETVTKVLNEFKASLKSLQEDMDKRAKQQEEQAKNLRDLQMQMLEKIEKYEIEKRKQAANLVEIKALLTGNLSEQETIELTIKSLNLSLKAIMRAREIIIEIAYFFTTFAAVMQHMMEDASEQSKKIEAALESESRLTNDRFVKHLKKHTNKFFVTQSAEWQAVKIVSIKFVDNFKEGWSTLNKLSGKYLTEDELKPYLEVAAKQIEDISRKRQQAADDKLVDLDKYRKDLQATG